MKVAETWYISELVPSLSPIVIGTTCNEEEDD